MWRISRLLIHRQRMDRHSPLNTPLVTHMGQLWLVGVIPTLLMRHGGIMLLKVRFGLPKQALSQRFLQLCLSIRR